MSTKLFKLLSLVWLSAAGRDGCLPVRDANPPLQAPATQAPAPATQAPAPTCHSGSRYGSSRHCRPHKR